jgi:GMP synthase-like glutamine amidotransferase
MKRKIALFNCYDIVKSMFNLKGKNVGEIELLMGRITSFSDVKVDVFHVCYDEFPQKDYDAYVISGSHYNPDRKSISKYPWMRRLLSFIRNTHERRIPQLGICFGHQMTAVAFGAKSFELPEPVNGYRKVIINEKYHAPLFDGVENEFYGAYFHKWAIYKTSLPFGSRLLATSPEIPDQAPSFSIGETTYAVQFHPERVAEDVKVMLEAHENMFGDEPPPEDLKKASRANVRVLENFVKWVAKGK